jgi:hypothetical protein
MNFERTLLYIVGIAVPDRKIGGPGIRRQFERRVGHGLAGPLIDMRESASRPETAGGSHAIGDFRRGFGK